MRQCHTGMLEDYLVSPCHEKIKSLRVLFITDVKYFKSKSHYKPILTTLHITGNAPRPAFLKAKVKEDTQRAAPF